MENRKPIPASVQTELLIKSGRRCCFCFGLLKDDSVKRGQVAHIDQNPANSVFDNLAFLCFEHHDEYDSKRSQSKGLTRQELLSYRAQLYAWISSRSVEERVSDFVDYEAAEIARIDKDIDKLRELGASAPGTLTIQIRDRIKRYVECLTAIQRTTDALGHSAFEDDIDTVLRENEFAVMKAYGIPWGIHGLTSDEEVSPEWMSEIDPLIVNWAYGRCSFSECTGLLFELDDRYDFDPFYFLYGIPVGELSMLGARYLRALVFEFGIRNRK